MENIYEYATSTLYFLLAVLYHLYMALTAALRGASCFIALIVSVVCAPIDALSILLDKRLQKHENVQQQRHGHN